MEMRRILEKATALSGVEPEFIQRMAAEAKSRTLLRSAYAWRAGDTPQHLTLVKNGLIKVVRPAPRGRSSICGLFGPRETIGDLALIKGIPYPADAVVATESATLIQVPRGLVMDAMARSPKLSTSIACAMHGKIAQLHTKIDVLSAGVVEARLATLLLRLYERFGDDLDDRVSCIPVLISRRELADLVSTAFETAIRVMTRWEREGVVATTGSGFLIKRRDVLEEVAGATDVGGELQLLAAGSVNVRRAPR